MKRKTWEKALEACRAKPGGDLVWLISQRTVDDVKIHIRNARKVNTKKFWVGKAGGWSWMRTRGRIIYR